jgi:hypothetical protein
MCFSKKKNKKERIESKLHEKDHSSRPIKWTGRYLAFINASVVS